MVRDTPGKTETEGRLNREGKQVEGDTGRDPETPKGQEREEHKQGHRKRIVDRKGEY